MEFQFLWMLEHCEPLSKTYVSSYTFPNYFLLNRWSNDSIIGNKTVVLAHSQSCDYVANALTMKLSLNECAKRSF